DAPPTAGTAGRQTRRERDRRVPAIVRSHPAQHGLVGTARGPEDADQIRAAAQGRGPRLEPADRVVDIGERRGVGCLGRHAEVQRRHHHAALRERLVDGGVVQAVAPAPGAAVKPRPRRLTRRRGQRTIAPGARATAPRQSLEEETDMRFGLFTSMGAQTWSGVLDLWRHIEATGWDIGCVTDHFMPNTKEREGAMLESWSTL